MEQQITLLGFGEAGQTFARSGAWGKAACAYDRLTDDPCTRPAKESDYTAAGVSSAPTPGTAASGADLILSLVTADQALEAARCVTHFIRPDTLYCDMNSVAPATKQAAAAAITSGGGHYVDVAIMAPVNPSGLKVPLLVSGDKAELAAKWLGQLGFLNVRVAGTRVGQASAIKMIRSVMVKGIEALTAECLLAAESAGVRAEVLASLDASQKATSWEERANYNLDRMMVHGLRRAHEMEEAMKTLEDLGVEPVMTRGTVRRQQEIGSLHLGAGPEGLIAKLDRLVNHKADAA